MYKRQAVAHAPGQIDRGPGHPFAQLGCDERGRAFLDQLLMAALHRAFALEQVYHVAEIVPDDLHLNMARVLDVLFHIQAPVAEIGDRFRRRAVVGVLQLPNAVRHADPLAAAARRGLKHNRIPDALGLTDRLVKIAQRPIRAERDRHARRDGVALGFGFIAHQTDGGRGLSLIHI